MKPRVYIETTIPSYLTARPTNDPVQSLLQKWTRDWWDGERGKYVLCSSQLVLDEAGKGDTQAAQARLDVLRETSILEFGDDAIELATELLGVGALPPNAADDALHIAISAIQTVPYLLTWNCKHIANATKRPSMERVCIAKGLKIPLICTPREFMENPQ